MTPREALLKAAEEVERRGLNKSGYSAGDDPGCRVCAMGALSVALFGGPDWAMFNYESDLPREAERLLAEAIKGSPVLPSESAFSLVVQFNDADETTAADVAAKMREAAENA